MSRVKEPRLLAFAGCMLVVICTAATQRATTPETVAHPALWPQARSVGLVDQKTESFVTELISRMSLEEKVGQMIQADMASITPEDLRSYPLGSILAGGNTPPLSGNDRDSAQE